MKKFFKYLFFAILTIILSGAVAFGIYVFSIVKEIKEENILNVPKSLEEQIAIIREISEGDGDNYSMGSANPKITIVEFSDFNCPYCKSASPKIRAIARKYPNDVKIIYRDFPGLPGSDSLALAARCAGEQGLFWQTHDVFFENLGKINSLGMILRLADSVGADKNQFQACLDTLKYKDQVQKDLNDGQKLQVSGTPTFFVNGRRFEGDAPLDAWEAVIEELLMNN